MPKTVTLRLSDEAYKSLSRAAVEDNRTISNLIETLALNKLSEEQFADRLEMEGIMSDAVLLKKLRKGHLDAKRKRGRMIG